MNDKEAAPAGAPKKKPGPAPIFPVKLDADLVIDLVSTGGKEKRLRLFKVNPSHAWFTFRPWKALDNGSQIAIVEGLHESVAKDWRVTAIKKVDA